MEMPFRLLARTALVKVSNEVYLWRSSLVNTCLAVRLWARSRAANSPRETPYPRSRRDCGSTMPETPGSKMLGGKLAGVCAEVISMTRVPAGSSSETTGRSRKCCSDRIRGCVGVESRLLRGQDRRRNARLHELAGITFSPIDFVQEGVGWCGRERSNVRWRQLGSVIWVRDRRAEGKRWRGDGTREHRRTVDDEILRALREVSVLRERKSRQREEEQSQGETHGGLQTNRCSGPNYGPSLREILGTFGPNAALGTGFD